MKEKMAKPKTTLICMGCGASFARSGSALKNGAGKGKYCTRACRDANWKGDVTPNWQGGNGVYKRGPHWQSTRRAILKRDNYQCQECGTANDLHVHHKTPFRMFDDPDQANHEDNMITLCAPCHRREDAKMKWLKVGDVIIKMPAGGYARQLAKAAAANDNDRARAVA